MTRGSQSDTSSVRRRSNSDDSNEDLYETSPVATPKHLPPSSVQNSFTVYTPTYPTKLPAARLSGLLGQVAPPANFPVAQARQLSHTSVAQFNVRQYQPHPFNSTPQPNTWTSSDTYPEPSQRPQRAAPPPASCPAEFADWHTQRYQDIPVAPACSPYGIACHPFPTSSDSSYVPVVPAPAPYRTELTEDGPTGQPICRFVLPRSSALRSVIKCLDADAAVGDNDDHTAEGMSPLE